MFAFGEPRTSGRTEAPEGVHRALRFPMRLPCSRRPQREPALLQRLAKKPVARARWSN